MNDKAIEFETCIYKVKKTLERLKKIGLDVSKHEKLVEEIIKECNEKTSYTTDTVFKDAFIENAYMKAISKLEDIYFELNKYEIYLKVSSFNQVLKEYIVSSEKKKEDLEDFRNRLLQLLDKLKKSDTLDYQVEGPLVEDIYELTYDFIKEEIKVLETSPTLQALQKNEIHIYNLDKQIANELEMLDLKDKKYALIKSQKNKIDAEGINATYLNEAFISTIIKSSISEEELEEKVTALSKKASCYYKKATDLENSIDINKKYIVEQNETKRMYLKKIYRNVVLFTTSVGTIVGLIVGSVKLGKVVATSKVYNVEIESYSSIDGELPVKEEIYSSEKNTIRLKEYEPFELLEDGSYTRDILTYNLDNLEEMPLEEYLNVNLEALGITGTRTYERKTSLDLSDLYTETYSIVEKLVTDENAEEEYSIGFHILISFVLLLISFFIDLLIEFCCLGESRTKRNEAGDQVVELTWGFVVALRKWNDNYKKFIECKQNIAEQDLKELYIDAKELFIENKEILTQFKQLIPYIENNASFTKDIEEIKEDLSRTLKIENKIFDRRELPNKNE